MQVKWPAGPPYFYANVWFARELILTGTVMTIDPSSGSKGSMPGFAIAERGEITRYGIIELPITSGKKIVTPQARYFALVERLKDLIPGRPDVLLIEQIGSKVHHLLLEAVGVSIVGAGTHNVIRVHNQVWKALANVMPGYEKGDSADAFMMCKAVLMIAKKFSEKDFSGFTEEALSKIKKEYR